jgi:hypothetical protein
MWQERHGRRTAGERTAGNDGWLLRLGRDSLYAAERIEDWKTVLFAPSLKGSFRRLLASRKGGKLEGRPRLPSPGAGFVPVRLEGAAEGF